MANDLVALLPFILLAMGGCIVLTLGVWRRYVSTWTMTMVTLSFLVASAVAAALWTVPQQVGAMLVIDGMSLVFTLAFTLGTAAIVLLAYGYAPTQGETRDEFLSLILFGTLGMALLASTKNLLAAFVGLEMLAVPLYALVAWRPSRPGAVEAGVKFGILAGFAAAFFLYGIILVYASAGTLDLTGISSSDVEDRMLTAAVILVLVGVGFKLALVPFHMWAPDIYQASPAPVTAFVATVAKAAALAFLIRLLSLQLPHVWEDLLPVIGLLAVVTMVVGNLLALRQQNLKRLLAYSSIAHLGYIMVALAAGNDLGRDAAIYYTVVYVIMNIGAFGVVAAVAHSAGDRETLSDYSGLGRRDPALGVAMGVCLLALAGLPPTAGFMAKFLAFGAAVDADRVALAVIAVLNTALAFFYYLRILVVLYKERGMVSVPRANGTIRIVVITATVATVLLGVFPGWLLNINYLNNG